MDKPLPTGDRFSDARADALSVARRRPRTRASRRLFGSRQARHDFLDALAGCGDPALVAAQRKLSLCALYRLRAEDGEFAARWDAAIAIAWEQVENRLLARLLASDDVPAAETPAKAGKAGGAGGVGAIDTRLALAILGPRLAAASREAQRAADRAADPVPESRHVERLRAELMAIELPR